MNDEQKELYLSLVMGVVSAIYLHNFFVSMNHFRNGRSFSILKIIFNFCGAMESTCFFFKMVLFDISLHSCNILAYIIFSTNFLSRESVALFLLCRLNRITSNSKPDRIISYFLLFLRTFFQITFIALIQTRVDISMRNMIGINSCEVDLYNARIASWGYVGTDLLIDIFVTIRMVQILTEGSRNAAQVDSITGRSPSNRKLFNAVIRWNYLRLASAFIFNALILINNIPALATYLIIHVFRNLNYIALTYFITIDKEIVKVIAGKFKIESEATSSRIIYDYTIENSKYSVSIKKDRFQKRSIMKRVIDLINSFNFNDIELDVNIILSKQKLTFIEWAYLTGWNVQDLESVSSERSISISVSESDD